MPRSVLNFYVKFTPGNFKSSGSAQRARAIFGSALLALQNFISAFKFYSCDSALLLKFAPQKSASVFKFSQRRFASNLRSTLRAVFAATRALSAKILSLIISLSQIVAQNFGKNLEINSAEAKILRKNHAFKFSAPFATKNPAPRNFVLLNSMPLNLTLRNSARENFTPQILYSGNFTRQNSNPQGFARQSLGQQGYAHQSFLARQNLVPQKSARRDRATKIAAPQTFVRLNLAAPQNFARLNLAASQNLSPLNSAFKFKASADV